MLDEPTEASLLLVPWRSLRFCQWVEALEFIVFFPVFLNVVVNDPLRRK